MNNYSCGKLLFYCKCKAMKCDWILSAEQLVIPVLKWVRGEPLSQDNWVELFCMIGLSKSMTLEKLTFGDLVAHSDGIINNADALKVMSSLCLHRSTILSMLFVYMFCCIFPHFAFNHSTKFT